MSRHSRECRNPERFNALADRLWMDAHCHGHERAGVLAQLTETIEDQNPKKTPSVRGRLCPHCLLCFPSDINTLRGQTIPIQITTVQAIGLF